MRKKFRGAKGILSLSPIIVAHHGPEVISPSEGHAHSSCQNKHKFHGPRATIETSNESAPSNTARQHVLHLADVRPGKSRSIRMRKLRHRQSSPIHPVNPRVTKVFLSVGTCSKIFAPRFLTSNRDARHHHAASSPSLPFAQPHDAPPQRCQTHASNASCSILIMGCFPERAPPVHIKFVSIHPSNSESHPKRKGKHDSRPSSRPESHSRTSTQSALTRNGVSQRETTSPQGRYHLTI